jgi:transposase
MASITKKTVSGRTYYYARECKRVNGRPKVVWQKYLGRLEDIIAAVTQRRAGLAPAGAGSEGWTVELGAVAALYDLCGRLDLAGIIDRHVPKRGGGPSVGTYLLVATINRCLEPCSKAGMSEWFEGTVLRRLVDIAPKQLTSQRYWDNMSRVSEEAIGAIEAELTARAVKEFELDLSRLLFDATNFFTFIDTFNDRSSLAKRGKSKEGRAALRIVGLALLVTADFHVPLFHETYPGNRNDATTFASLTERLVARCQLLTDGVEHVTLVFDKGNNSQDNLDAVESAPFHFVGSLVPTQHQDLLAIDRERFVSLADQGLPGASAVRVSKTVFGHQRAVLVVFNENLLVAQSQTILREIGKRQQWLRDLVANLQSWRDRPPRGRKPTVEAVRKKINGWLTAQHMRQLFQVQVTERDGLPDVTYRFDQEAWQKLQDDLLGKTILFTDNDDWTDADIVRAYRAQHHIEGAFRGMKDPHCIALRPQHHWTDQKIRVHVLTCVVALMLLSLLQRELHRHGIDCSFTRMTHLLAAIKEVIIATPTTTGAKPSFRFALSRMSPEQRQIYEILRLHRYTNAA